MRKIHNLVQGSPEWHAYRANHFNASDAPAMMGESPYKTRDKLLHEVATGIVEEVDAHTQKRFDDGHEFEAVARLIAEKIIGDDLFPSTVSLDVEGLPLSASLDGWTMDETIIFEHKTMNKTLEAVFDGPITHFSGGELPLMYRIQMEQQLMISGAEKCLFMASKGTEDTAKHVWYLPDPKLRFEIISAWHQFDLDRQSYVPPAVQEKPAGAVIKDLPALLVEITGEVKSSNLAAYKANALDFVRNIKTDLQTDQDFADAENVVKFCDRVEKELEIVKKSTLSQASSIDEVVRTIDQLKEEMRQKRLALEKLIEREKESRKAAIVSEAIKIWNSHIADLNNALGKPLMPAIAANFAAAGKGKRTIETFRSAVNDEIARVRAEANRIASNIEINLELLRELASDHKFLFSDTAQLVLKEKDSLEAIIKQRIAEYLLAEKETAEAKAKLEMPKHPAESMNLGDYAKPVISENRTVQSDFEMVFSGGAASRMNQKLNDYQQGLLDGLDLALGIFMTHGANGFTKAVEDFIESDCLPEAPKPKVAA